MRGHLARGDARSVPEHERHAGLAIICPATNQMRWRLPANKRIVAAKVGGRSIDCVYMGIEPEHRA